MATNGNAHTGSGTWLDVDADSHFSLANIPFGIVSHASSNNEKVVASRIGESVIDLSILEKAGLFVEAFGAKDTSHFAQSTLKEYASVKRFTQKKLRAAIQSLFAADNATLRDNSSLRARAIVPLAEIESHIPFSIGGFVDYSVFPNHGLNAGRAMFGPDTLLPPYFTTLPMVYNGRASTVTIDTEIIRPQGQCRAFAPPPIKMSIGPCQTMDHEFELGAFIGHETQSGSYLAPKDSTDYIFGVVILNDWSARDIQAFEMTPLGPFNGKAFATTISPWVVTMDALDAFRIEMPERYTNFAWAEPEHLKLPSGFLGGIDITCDTRIKLAEEGASGPEHHIATANFSGAYWSFEQMLVHNTFCGAPLRTGDLIGSGTISGPQTPGSNGCFLEMGKGGKEPIDIAGYKRAWLEDGDEIILEACAGKEKYKKVGFGTLRGKLLPAARLVKAPALE